MTRIESAYYRGEKEIQVNGNVWKLDGYAENSNGRKCWEFNGCAFHRGCPHCGENEALSDTWLAKTNDLKSLNIEMEVIWSCEFKRQLPKISKTETPSSLNLILQQNQSESDLLTAIKNGRVFGLLVCDLSCPPEISEKFHNFPPFVNRMTLTEEHLTDFMKEKLFKERGVTNLKQETLVQVFNAKEYLLLSAVAQEYMKWGIVVSNIRWFMQYEKAEVLRPFADAVTAMRIEAEKVGDSTKSTTAKIFGNSGYGKV